MPRASKNNALLSAKPQPLADLDLPRGLVVRLQECGIVTTLQLVELLDLKPHRIKISTGMPAKELRRMLTKAAGVLPNFNTSGICSPMIPPAAGVIGPLPEEAMVVDAGFATSGRIRQYLDMLDQLPGMFFLVDQMQRVGDQGPYGFCVGFAANATSEFNLTQAKSSGYSYWGAKSRDGHPYIVGSWLRYAFEHRYLVGHVSEREYSYLDAIKNLPIEPLATKASLFRSRGFTSLIDYDGEYHHIPKLFRAIVSGQLSKELGPHPIPISIRLYQSFSNYSTSHQGLVSLPFSGEKTLGGHAMVIVGYIDADHPSNPFNVSYFLVRNSWSETWAARNPFEAPDHALIPEAYFTSDDRLFEAYLCVG